jgi:sugar phosphate isomerase/epimerase
VNAPREPAESLVHRGLGRVELFDFAAADMAGLPHLLVRLAEEGRGRLSLHAPIVRPEWFPFAGVATFFLCEDADRRELSFRLLEGTLAEARRLGAEHVVCHLTYGPTDSRDPATARRLADRACARMAALAGEAGVPLHLEFAAYSDAFHEPAAFAEAVAAHPGLLVCVDVGHAFIGAEKRGRDYLADVAALAPLAGSLHLWNTKGAAHARARGHEPLHPAQRPADGWADVEAALGIVLAAAKDAAVIFEYPVAAVTPEIQAGYDWIAGAAARLRGEAGTGSFRGVEGKAEGDMP